MNIRIHDIKEKYQKPLRDFQEFGYLPKSGFLRAMLADDIEMAKAVGTKADVFNMLNLSLYIQGAAMPSKGTGSYARVNAWAKCQGLSGIYTNGFDANYRKLIKLN